MELLVAIAIASIVLVALLQVFVGTLRADAHTEDRVASTASVRLGLERTVSALDSQVCADPVTPPIVPGSTATQVTYYADAQAPSTTSTPTPDGAHRERLTYNASAGTVVLERWADVAGTGTPTVRTLAQGVAAPTGGPFSYFAYQVDSNGVPTPEAAVAAPVTSTTATGIVRVRVQLIGQALRGGQPTVSSPTVVGDAYVGSLDPIQPTLGPRCAA